MVTLDQSRVLAEAPVQGRFVPPSCRVLVTDASLLAALLQHWPRVELRKKETRDAAYDTLVANLNTDGFDEASVDRVKSNFREYLNLPERWALETNWAVISCLLS